MNWSKLPENAIVYVDRDEWINNNPITRVGVLYIEQESRWCKIGSGRRYTEVSYTPWSVSTESSTIVTVENIVIGIEGLDESKKYIWNGGSLHPKGYILEYINSTWSHAVPADNSLAWVSALYQLKFWDGVTWNNVDANTHNTQFGVEGGKDGHFFHLGEDEYINISRSSWRYPVNGILSSAFPSNPTEGYRVAVSPIVVEGSDSYEFRGFICEYKSGQWIPEPQVDGQTVVNLNDGLVYVWYENDWVVFEGQGGGQGDHSHTFVGLSDVITSNPQVGQVYAINALGSVENTNVSDLLGTPGNALTVPANTPNQDEILVSDGEGGTYTAGIGVNQYNQLDLAHNGVKNAIIDCGTFYA